MTFTGVADEDITQPVAVVEPPPGPPDAPGPDDDAGDGTPPAVTARFLIKRSLVRGAIAVALVAVVVVGFEAGITRVWYDAHQRALGSDFAVGRAKLQPGQAAALLQIPAIDLNATVIEGDTTDQLRDGPGLRPGTPLPGRRGNSVIFGHRHGWGGPFADLDQLHSGSLIVAKIRGPSPTVFKVVAVKHVPADDTRLLAPSTDYRMTLVTGDGGDFSSDRLVVVAVSGTKGKLRSAKGVEPSADNGSPILNGSIALAVAALGAAWVAFEYVRRRYRTAAVAAVVVPLVLAGVMALLLAADRVLPPLR